MYQLVNDILMVPSLNGTLVPLDDCQLGLCALEYAYIEYIPTLGGNLAYLIIFALLLVAQTGLLWKYRTWSYYAGMSGGLILEILGYGGRLGMNDNPFNFTWFILSLVTLTIAPAFLAASIYLCLGRLVQVYGENISRFSSRFYTFTFITCDFFSLLLQAVGGALSATDSKTNPTDVGVNIMIAGLAFQVVSLALFMFLSLEFAYRAIKAREANLNFDFFKLRQRKMFRLLPYALALATVTIFIRCAFRVAELQDGFSGDLANDEPMFMGFEGPMIIVAVVAMTLVHPGIAFGTAANWQAASFPWKQSRKAKRAAEDEVKLPSMTRASSDDTVVGEDEPKEQI